MTGTLLSLLSITLGILGGLFTGNQFKKYSLGLTGNTIAGVFGSILMTKTFGRLGFDTHHIISAEGISLTLLSIQLIMSLLAGGVAVILSKIIALKMS